MITPVSELIAAAREQISCMDIDTSKSWLSENNTAIIIDVREPHEAEASQLSDSVNIPRGQLEMKISDVSLEPEQPLLIHCAAGGRASLAALTLKNMGYTNVHALTANYDEIKQALG